MWLRSSAFCRPAALAIGLVVGSLALTATPAPADTKAELEAARSQLRAIEERVTIGQKRLAELRAKANAIVAQMNQVESTIALIQQELNTVRREITTARRRIRLNQRQLDNRVRAMFQTGGAVELGVLLRFTSLFDLSSRVEIIQRATERDRDLIERARALAARLWHRQAELEELERVRSAERNDLRTQATRLQEQFAAQAMVIRQMDEDRRAAEALIQALADKRTRELKGKRKREIQRARQVALAASQAIVGSSRPSALQATANLSRPAGAQPETGSPNQQGQPSETASPTDQAPQGQTESTNEQTPQSETGFPEQDPLPQTTPPNEEGPQATNDSSSGRSRNGETDSSATRTDAGTVFEICPVDQPRAYTDDFGAPRSGGRIHKGNDIFAPHGTPVRAPFDGTAYESSNGLGGLAVTVRGAPGHVYNAHLSRFGRLGRVTAGTIIGYVGNTGNARGTSPHNHFEWHPGTGGAVNPYSYLNEVC